MRGRRRGVEKVEGKSSSRGVVGPRLPVFFCYYLFAAYWNLPEIPLDEQAGVMRECRWKFSFEGTP